MDVIGNPLVATTETVALVDFTYIMAIEQTVLIQKLPGLESRLFAIVKPFQLLVNTRKLDATCSTLRMLSNHRWTGLVGAGNRLSGYGNGAVLVYAGHGGTIDGNEDADLRHQFRLRIQHAHRTRYKVNLRLAMGLC